MTASHELSVLVDGLPAEKVRSLLDYARYLAEQSADDAWDRQVASAQSSPRFRQRLAEVERDVAAGRAVPLDPDQL